MQLARFFRPCLADLPLGDLGATAQIATGSAKFLQLGPTLLLSVALTPALLKEISSK